MSMEQTFCLLLTAGTRTGGTPQIGEIAHSRQLVVVLPKAADIVVAKSAA
jgi:hypothetical protein